MTERQRITSVVPSGGSGTRLWPLLRSGKPEQLLALTHTETMLQLTAARDGNAERFAAPVVVASTGHADEIEPQLAAGVSTATLMREPAARNTAPAIERAAEPDAILLMTPSDHVIAHVFEGVPVSGTVFVRTASSFGIGESMPTLMPKRAPSRSDCQGLFREGTTTKRHRLFQRDKLSHDAQDTSVGDNAGDERADR